MLVGVPRDLREVILTLWTVFTIFFALGFETDSKPTNHSVATREQSKASKVSIKSLELWLIN